MTVAPSGRRARRRWSDSGGSVAVEFAIIAPVMMLLLFGTVRAGHALGVQHALTQLAADAARHVLPEPVSERRIAQARSYVVARAPAYVLLAVGPTDCEVTEVDGVLSVRVSVDVSRLPDIPIVAAAYTFPKVQTATAVISVQR